MALRGRRAIGTSERVKGYFTLLLRRAPAVTLTVALAGMLIVSPVRGLRPVRAARLTFWNDTKPGIGDLVALGDLRFHGLRHALDDLVHGGLRDTGTVRDGVDQLRLVHVAPPQVVGFASGAYP